MKTSQLAYSKVILGKVSFCEKLFGKELRKSVAQLSPAERLALHAWCARHFGVQYPAVIDAVFSVKEPPDGLLLPVLYETTADLP